MKLKKVLGTLACVVGISGFASVANADPIGPNCGSCFGGIFTLEFVETGENQIQVTVTADLTGTIDPDVTGIGAVAFKIVAQSDEIVSVTSSTAGTISSGNLSASGCNDAGGGFVCLQLASPILLANTNPDFFQFVFNVTLTSTANLLLATSGDGMSSLKIDLNPTGKGPLLSENIQLQVPDGGSTIALLGSALLGIGILRRRFNL